ncbi:hypothetical protein C8F04DRAFT_953926, partial [Mycena alexandri]
YAIFFGQEIGVFKSWNDVQTRTSGHGLAIYAGYTSLTAATAALEYARRKGWTGDTSPPPYDARPPLPTDLTDNALNQGTINKRWYAVCRGIAPGVYRSYLKCSLNVSGVKRSLHSSFDTRAEAEHAFSQALRNGLVETLVRTSPVE